MSKPIRVVTVDDHPIVREGLRLMLATSDDLQMVGDAADGASALQLIEEVQPDVVLLDLRMPGMDGIETLEHIRASWPQVAVLILTTYNEDEMMMRGLQLGARGYLLKEMPLETVFQAIRTAARGEITVQPEVMARILAYTAFSSTPRSVSAPTLPPSFPISISAQEDANFIQLTEREREVLKGVARGERSKEIAAHLGITERTVRAYLTNIYNKLGVDSRAAAVAVALESGLLSR
ncbi:MAG TPA: response regulator transcription factor [Ktedonobacteraceae bacterium]|jgi:NarL family two-component system response regulator YdfI|nr:response regulator transcription factor [Ktedonobacteraceae bacterium]